MTVLIFQIIMIVINEVHYPNLFRLNVITKQCECNFKGKYVEMCPLPSNSRSKDAKLATKVINNQIWSYML